MLGNYFNKYCALRRYGKVLGEIRGLSLGVIYEVMDSAFAGKRIKYANFWDLHLRYDAGVSCE